MSQLPKPPGRSDEKNNIKPSVEMLGALALPMLTLGGSREAFANCPNELSRLATRISLFDMSCCVGVREKYNSSPSDEMLG